ncbi:MAG: DsrH/TusB family sulfur metabolism protein [Nitrospiraceae bacterium]|nr:DsrH/TusB family sulfur metabolism protein [Nitrospiraceae bacterium]
MLFIIKSAPDTPEGRRGVSLAKESGADVVLLQNGVYFANAKNAGQAFADEQKVYVIEEESRLRGLHAGKGRPGNIKGISYGEFVGLLENADKVQGTF